MSGKGSAPRPFSVPLDEFADRFDAIFRKADGVRELQEEAGATEVTGAEVRSGFDRRSA